MVTIATGVGHIIILSHLSVTVRPIRNQEQLVRPMRARYGAHVLAERQGGRGFDTLHHCSCGAGSSSAVSRQLQQLLSDTTTYNYKHLPIHPRITKSYEYM